MLTPKELSNRIALHINRFHSEAPTRTKEAVRDSIQAIIALATTATSMFKVVAATDASKKGESSNDSPKTKR